MYNTERDRAHNLFQDENHAEQARPKLVWDPVARRVRAVTPDPSDDTQHTLVWHPPCSLE